MKKLYGIIIAGLMGVANCDAVIHKVELWRDQNGNEVIALSDTHTDTAIGKVTFRQRQEIIDLAKKIKAYTILEDMGCYGGDNPDIQQAIKDNTLQDTFWTRMLGWLTPSFIEKRASLFAGSMPVMDGLTAEMQKQGLEAESVEYRHACYREKSKVLARDIYQEGVDKIAEINAYQDGPQMAEIYTWLMDKFNTWEAPCLEVLEKQGNLALNDAKSKDWESCTVFVHLLDIAILRALHVQLQQGKKRFILVVGGNHLKGGVQVGLHKMGFDLQGHIGQVAVAGDEQEKRAQITQAPNIIKAYEQLGKASLSNVKNVDDADRQKALAESEKKYDEFAQEFHKNRLQILKNIEKMASQQATLVALKKAVNVYKHCDDARSQEVTEIAFEQHRASSIFSKKIAAAQKNVDEAGNENALAAAKEELANVLKKQEESRERLRAKEKESQEKYNKCKQDAEK